MTARASSLVALLAALCLSTLAHGTRKARSMERATRACLARSPNASSGLGIALGALVSVLALPMPGCAGMTASQGLADASSLLADASQVAPLVCMPVDSASPSSGQACAKDASIASSVAAGIAALLRTIATATGPSPTPAGTKTLLYRNAVVTLPAGDADRLLATTGAR